MSSYHLIITKIIRRFESCRNCHHYNGRRPMRFKAIDFPFIFLLILWLLLHRLNICTNTKLTQSTWHKKHTLKYLTMLQVSNKLMTTLRLHSSTPTADLGTCKAHASQVHVTRWRVIDTLFMERGWFIYFTIYDFLKCFKIAKHSLALSKIVVHYVWYTFHTTGIQFALKVDILKQSC